MTTPPDDSLMNRFDEHGLCCFRARDAIAAVFLAALLLALFEGTSIRRAGERMDPGVSRDFVMAVGKPAGWIAEQLPFAALADDATAWLSPDEKLTAGTGFSSVSATTAPAARVAPVTPDAFAAGDIGARPDARRPLRTLLVTGDSMSTPLDTHLARLLARTGVRVIRDPHLGTGISKSFVVDWGELSTRQVRDDHPDAVVVFIGANEGFPMPGPDGREVQCCGADWAAVYANRVRRMADTYRQNGGARVYWVTLPTPRDADHQPITRVVNAALKVAVQPWRAQVRVIDTVPTFSPTGYRDAMSVDGVDTIVRHPDGKHLSDAGSRLLAELVLREVGRDYVYRTG
jgi:hypothetical protein